MELDKIINEDSIIFTRIRECSFLELAYKELAMTIDTHFLQNFSDLYVLAIEYDEELVSLLDEHQFQLLKDNYYYIIGFMLLEDRVQENSISNVHYITECISRLDECNVRKYMIQRYEDMYKEYIVVVPREISEDNVYFWYKYFSEMYNIHNLEDLETCFKNEHCLFYIFWEPYEKLLDQLPKLN